MVFFQLEAMTRDQLRHLQVLAEGHSFLVHHRPGNNRIECAMPAYSFFWSRDTIDEVSINRRAADLQANHFLAINPGEAVTIAPGCKNRTGFFQISVCHDLVRTATTALASSSRSFGKQGACKWPVKFAARPRPCDGHFGPILRDVEKAASLRIQDAAWLEGQMHLFVELLLFDESVAAKHRRAGLPSSNVGAKLKRARQLLDSQFHKPIEIRDLARDLAISRAHFIREFRRYYGETPYRYLINKRLDAALRLITEEEVPVGLVFDRVGFNSGSVFYKAFRRRYKLTPSQARRTGFAEVG